MRLSILVHNRCVRVIRVKGKLVVVNIDTECAYGVHHCATIVFCAPYDWRVAIGSIYREFEYYHVTARDAMDCALHHIRHDCRRFCEVSAGITEPQTDGEAGYKEVYYHLARNLIRTDRKG